MFWKFELERVQKNCLCTRFYGHSSLQTPNYGESGNVQHWDTLHYATILGSGYQFQIFRFGLGNYVYLL
jgi:hypothetical protein